MHASSPSDPLVLGNRAFTSRLLLGTGKYADVGAMLDAVRASGAQIVTVALRRFNPERPDDDLAGPLCALPGVTLMPNTSGALNAKEALTAARVSFELCGSRLIKLELHPNPHHLLPDAVETFEAARLLIADGFDVMPYIPPDPVLAKRLEEIGCVSVMPLAAPIGSGGGLRGAEMIRLIVRDARVPVIVDAGLRAPSDAAAALEMGCDAVLINSAIAASEHPSAMAGAFAQAVVAGRAAFHAGLMTRHEGARATSPLTAFLGGGAPS